jgi:hypothetical protein
MSFSFTATMPEFKSKEEYEKYKADKFNNGESLLNIITNENDISDESDYESDREKTFGNEPIFNYEIIIPETIAKITLTKEQVVKKIEELSGKTLSEDEGNKAWRKIKRSDDFYSTFCEYAKTRGVYYYGSSDYQLYGDCFEEGVKKAIQDSIDGDFLNLWDNLLERALDDISSKLKTEKINVEEITWENIASHTKKQIQDENVKNGLPRCENEIKLKSINKWRENYVKTHIIKDVVLPNGKDKDELIKNIIATLL